MVKTQKSTRNDLKISDWISISFPRSNKDCCVCGNQVTPFGLILKSNPLPSIYYAWAHLTCMKDVMPSKLRYKFYYPEGLDKPVVSDKIGCSYCGVISEKYPLLSFGDQFLLHEECIPKLYAVIQEVYLDNEKYLLTRLI